MTAAGLMACFMLLILYGKDKALCGQAAGVWVGKAGRAV